MEVYRHEDQIQYGDHLRRRVHGGGRRAVVPDPLPDPDHGETAINAQTLPRIAIGGIFLFAVCLLLEGLFAREKKELVVTRESFRSEGFRKEMRSVLYALFLVAYCFAVEPLGFILSTVILVVAIMIYFGARKWYYYAIPWPWWGWCTTCSPCSSMSRCPDEKGECLWNNFWAVWRSWPVAELPGHPPGPGHRHRGGRHPRPDLRPGTDLVASR
jgi:hypothetical protein